MKTFLDQAREIQDEIIANRRFIHSCAEWGFDLPRTYAYVVEQLESYGYHPEKTGKMGIVCTAGRPGPTILLRADMDALPMAEETGASYAATNGYCHSCGHDCHTAMLLGAAKLLKSREGELAGTVKFMFQPAEEQLAGALDMIEHGVLENPRVDAALAFHITVGLEAARSGRVCCVHHCAKCSGDAVRILVEGKDAHGAQPELGVDAIHIAAHIILALEGLKAREVPIGQESVVLVGRIEGGTTCNTMAGQAILDLSIRATGPEERAFLLRRTEEIARGVAATFRGAVRIEHQYGAPALVNNEELLQEFQRYLREMLPAEQVVDCEKLGGTEDFTMLAEKVPSVFLELGVGSPDEGYPYSIHQPAMQVDESALATGAAAYAQCALRWLEAHGGKQ